MFFSGKYIISFIIMGSLAVGCGELRHAAPGASPQEAWNGANDPLRLNEAYQTQFNSLPLSGSLKGRSVPWTDTYWPSYVGGIAVRWNTKNPESTAFRYVPPPLQRLKVMSEAELASLSPAEKFDILRGRYDYPTVLSERKRTSPRNPSWWGLCHGWAAASIQFPEPKALTVTNADGVSVPFGSSDVKALLTYYLGVEKLNSYKSKHVGVSCKTKLVTTVGRIFRRTVRIEGGPECRDMNAGAFHMALANQIGILGRSFVIDKDREEQIWNQPVLGYRSVVLGRSRPSANAAPGTIEVVQVRTLLTYATEISPQWEPANGTDDYAAATVQYDYKVELDGSGRILGGQWISSDRPDFAWTVSDQVPLEGDWELLKSFL